MDNMPLSLLATVGGFSIPIAMAANLLVTLGKGWFRARDEDAEFLELYVNGKDYSVDLRTITNGGSLKIHKALQEMERCK